MALYLYKWNAEVSQALYTYIQAWEICLRNKINMFLSWKYGAGWPYDARLLRNLKNSDRVKLQEAVKRQETARRLQPVSTPAVVADLSAGFWVSQLGYDIPHVWRHNIAKIFPNQKIAATEARAVCSDILEIRNRIAHHEPLFRQPLAERHTAMRQIVRAMCEPTYLYAESMCTFAAVMAKRPAGPA